jgi:polysaccharide pyruvyl transferase CsaB
MSIVIAGYYGFGNAGDELILLSLIRQFRLESPDLPIIVFSETPSKTAADYGVRAVDRWRFWTWVIPLLTARRFILGGGGLLQEKSGPWNFAYYLSLVLIAKLWGCRTEIMAIGVDPIDRPLNRFWTRFVLNHWVDEMSVRDVDSRRELQVAGVTMPVVIRPDPVSDLVSVQTRAPSTRIALALSAAACRPEDIPRVAQLIRRIEMELKVAVELLVFFPQEDEAIAREISRATMMPPEVRVWQNPLDLLSWIPQYQLVVGSRFHALVLAAANHLPFIGWGGQKKIESYCGAHQMPYANTESGWNEEHLFAQIVALYQSQGKIVILQHELIDFPL